MLLTRRSFLKRGATMVAAGWAVPSFIAETARLLDGGQWTTPTALAANGRRVLVIVQFAGGNDGLNTLIPYGDPVYYSPSTRPTLAIDRPNDPGTDPKVIPINDYVGLHPSLARLKARYDQGLVAIAQGVSYPNPNRSHFRGTDIWETAVPERLEPTGWVGRYLASCNCQRSDHLEAMMAGSSNVAKAFWTEMALVPAVASIGNFRYTSVGAANSPQRSSEIQTLRTALAQADGQPDAEFLRQSILTALTDSDILTAAAASYNPIGAYPANNFGNSMKLVAQLIAADVGTSIFFVSLGGFDTHSNQLGQHANLLSTFDGAMDSFLQDLEHVGRLGDVTVMTFSEFGRRLAGNGSGGSDHGIAAPMFLLGGSLKGGLHSTYPSLTDLNNGDLKMQVDFRSIYATVLQDWLQISPNGILGGSFPTLGLFKSGSSATSTATSSTLISTATTSVATSTVVTTTTTATAMSSSTAVTSTTITTTSAGKHGHQRKRKR